jgi:hypothetical protein
VAGRVLFLVGASGVGKTAALLHLRSLPDFAGACYFFDHIGVPSPDEILELDRQGVSWQAQATRAWIEKLDRATCLDSRLSAHGAAKFELGSRHLPGLGFCRVWRGKV